MAEAEEAVVVVGRDMTEYYDVIIIGAGPAGLACAAELKDSALSVLILEKNEIIGEKICAGGLTFIDESLNLPPEKIRIFKTQFICLRDKKYEIPLSRGLVVADRLVLGEQQERNIKDSKNIKILKNTRVESIEDNQVKTSAGIFHFKYLVGADGTNSITRRYLKLSNEYSFALHYEIPLSTNEAIFYLDPKILKSGYIWEFPHKNFTSVGIYFKEKHFTAEAAKKILTDYLKNKSYPFAKANFFGAPINHSFKGFAFKNIFLIGEAAGLVSSTTGEGIYFALVSGKEIGKKIINSSYSMPKLKKIIKTKNRQDAAMRLAGLLNTPLPIQNFIIKIFIHLARRTWFQKYVQ